MTIDKADFLHVVWSTVNTNCYNQAVYYARSEFSGEVWEEVVMMQDADINNGFTGFPFLLSYRQDNLIITHVDQSNIGRIEHTSTDGGRTWSRPRNIVNSMEGVNGFMIPLVDGRGDLHLVINMRPSANHKQASIMHHVMGVIERLFCRWL